MVSVTNKRLTALAGAVLTIAVRNSAGVPEMSLCMYVIAILLFSVGVTARSHHVQNAGAPSTLALPMAADDQ
ncbi:hypothetical protein LMG24238_07691 [Paraburkholderia sediminicola]|uniref:Uncharacterized protein n=1 Tax=Paraburkholderia sediminicola TaxID=458836 RepID=A0A6J5CWM9_9BURK|nr:hypothetical protein LMG24238_07691 [Paraburkholderia sediminicola]